MLKARAGTRPAAAPVGPGYRGPHGRKRAGKPSCTGRKPWRRGRKAPKLTVKFPQPARGIPLSQRQKIEVLLPPQHTASLNTLRGVRREMCRVYRGVANGRVSSDEATRRIYILKEIRAALEAETLTDIQQRLAMLSRDMDNPNGQRLPHRPALPSG